PPFKRKPADPKARRLCSSLASCWLFDDDVAAPTHVLVAIMAILVVVGAGMLAIDLDVVGLVPLVPHMVPRPVAVAVTVGDGARIEGHVDVSCLGDAERSGAHQGGDGRGFHDGFHGGIPLMN